MNSILIHTQYYPPEIGAPQARLSELAIGLRKRGFKVKVLTAMPNYPKGRLFDGYGGLRLKEILNGIPVTRTWIYPTNKLGIFPRLLNYFSFVFSSLFLGIWGQGKIDYLLTESPPLFTGISGYLLSRIKRARWIFNVSDLWPESAVRLGALKKGWGLKLASWLEEFCYRKAWLVTGQSRSILADIQGRFPNVSTYHLSNGVDTELFGPDNFQSNIRKKLSPTGDLIYFYGGLHGLAQGLEQILLAAKNAPKGVHFVLMGDGPEKEALIAKANQLNLNNVSYFDPVEKQEMPAILASVDVCLVPLKMDLPGAVPSKLYEAMASAKPVILIAEGEARDIVVDNNVGLTVKPGDIQGIIKAVELLSSDPILRQNLGKNGIKTARNYFSREKIVQDFASLLLESQS